MPQDDSDIRTRLGILESQNKSILEELKELKEQIKVLTTKVNEEMSGFQLELVRMKMINQVLIFLGGVLTTGLIGLMYDFIRRAFVGV